MEHERRKENPTTYRNSCSHKAVPLCEWKHWIQLCPAHARTHRNSDTCSVFDAVQTEETKPNGSISDTRRHDTYDIYIYIYASATLLVHSALPVVHRHEGAQLKANSIDYDVLVSVEFSLYITPKYYSSYIRFHFLFHYPYILWMDEILHHLGAPNCCTS